MSLRFQLSGVVQAEVLPKELPPVTTRFAVEAKGSKAGLVRTATVDQNRPTASSLLVDGGANNNETTVMRAQPTVVAPWGGFAILYSTPQVDALVTQNLRYTDLIRSWGGRTTFQLFIFDESSSIRLNPTSRFSLAVAGIRQPVY